MSDQINDPRAEPPASGAEFSTDPTGATTYLSSPTADADTVDTSSPMQRGAQQVGDQTTVGGSTTSGTSPLAEHPVNDTEPSSTKTAQRRGSFRD